MQNVLVTFPDRPLRWQTITFIQLIINSSSKATLLPYSSFCPHTYIIQFPGKLSYSILYLHRALNKVTQSANQHINPIHWHKQNVVIPCRSQEPPQFLPIIHFFLPLLSADHSSILPHFIHSSISWSTSWSCCFQIHIQYSFGNPIFFPSLYMSKPT